jgi:hypothetical protein
MLDKNIKFHFRTLWEIAGEGKIVGKHLNLIELHGNCLLMYEQDGSFMGGDVEMCRYPVGKKFGDLVGDLREFVTRVIKKIVLKFSTKIVVRNNQRLCV